MIPLPAHIGLRHEKGDSQVSLFGFIGRSAATGAEVIRISTDATVTYPREVWATLTAQDAKGLYLTPRHRTTLGIVKADNGDMIVPIARIRHEGGCEALSAWAKALGASIVKVTERDGGGADIEALRRSSIPCGCSRCLGSNTLADAIGGAEYDKASARLGTAVPNKAALRREAKARLAAAAAKAEARLGAPLAFGAYATPAKG